MKNSNEQKRSIERIALYWKIWRVREDADGNHYSQVSGRRMPGKFSTLYFDHLLPKSKYPKLEMEPENIIICLPEEHELKTNGKPLQKHRELIEKAKEKFGIL